MWTGVIVMIATMAIWVSTMIVAPTATPLPCGRASRGAAVSVVSAGSVPVTGSASARATSNGSGRRNANSTAPATP